MNRTLLLLLFACSVALIGCKKKIALVNNVAEDGPPAGQDGAGCTSDRQCDGDICLGFGQGWRGGYCTSENCVEGGCNGDDSQCIPFLDGSSLCLDGCVGNADCRAGYRCRALDASGNKVCFRDDGDGPPAGSIGSDCGTDADCYDGLVCDPAARNGYCITTNCDDCPRDTTCAQWPGSGDRCLQDCDDTRDCRTGYLCTDDVCIPGQDVGAPFDFATTEALLGIQCGGENLGPEDFGTRWRLTFEVPAGITGYALVPYVPTGSLRPIELGLPSGATVDLISDYKHHNIRITEFQFFDQESDGTYGEVALDWPLLIPYSPDRADLLESGTHTLDVITSVTEPCLYVLDAGGGSVIDLNLVFVGLEGYGAATAASDPDIQEVLERMDEILEPNGFRLGETRYFDAPVEIAERYGFVRDETELRRITAFGEPRSESLDGHLNVDMFLVQDVRLQGGGILFGISAGLPGPPALHGNPANGLVFTGADIGSDNAFVAHIMAHELGHYLGLRHTTETVHNRESGVEFDFFLGTTDPISDTPVCASVEALQTDCPDYTNLMFPYAPLELFQPTISEGQAAVMRANPILKAE